MSSATGATSHHAAAHTRGMNKAPTALCLYPLPESFLCVVRQAFEKDPIATYFSKGPSCTVSLARAQFALTVAGLPLAQLFFATPSLHSAVLAMHYPQDRVTHTHSFTHTYTSHSLLQRPPSLRRGGIVKWGMSLYILKCT